MMTVGILVICGPELISFVCMVLAVLSSIWFQENVESMLVKPKSEHISLGTSVGNSSQNNTKGVNIQQAFGRIIDNGLSTADGLAQQSENSKESEGNSNQSDRISSPETVDQNNVFMGRLSDSDTLEELDLAKLQYEDPNLKIIKKNNNEGIRPE